MILRPDTVQAPIRIQCGRRPGAHTSSPNPSSRLISAGRVTSSGTPEMITLHAGAGHGIDVVDLEHRVIDVAQLVQLDPVRGAKRDALAGLVKHVVHAA